MRTLVISFVAALACATTAFAAEEYIDQDTKFRVSIPDGWQKYPKVADKIALVLASPRVEQSEAMCIVLGEAIEGTETAAQGDINEQMGGFDEAFWRSVAEDQNTKDVKVEATTEIRNGRKASLATIRYISTTDGKEAPTVERYILYVIPGRILMGECGTLAAHEKAEEADIKTVMSSLEPTGGGLISKLAPRGNEVRLLFQAGPRSTIGLAADMLKRARTERAKLHRHR
jgi:hypothetical protein